MKMKMALLAGISATAMVVASSTIASAECYRCGWGSDAVDDVKSNSDNNDQDIEIGSDNSAGGGWRRSRFSRGGGSADGFDDHNAVAVAALQQNSVQIVASKDEDAIDDDYDAEMDFGRNAFRGQTLNNNNFNSGVNALQGNGMAVAGTSDSSFNAGPEG